ncbi:MAG: pancreas/duodenum homeobox protein 1 [Deltaproteobacteria bacterium]|nr:pancreas/duodenum homeobox protein 1 [Deltaproteobacteria bacterium]
MSEDNYDEVFTPEVLERLLPPERSDEFFEALFGDAKEGAYDISLKFEGHKNGNFNFALVLNQRPGQCLVCSLTRGLPEVFSRHTVINLAGIAGEIGKLLGHDDAGITWQLAATRQHSAALHTIPFIIEL